MGRLPDKADDRRTRPLPRDMEMAFVGGAVQRSPLGEAWVAFLASNPDAARELGSLAVKAAADMAAAYPGETREAIPNREWAAAGYGRVVEANRAMGLAGL